LADHYALGEHYALPLEAGEFPQFPSIKNKQKRSAMLYSDYFAD
jgi:hypothetical protein